MNSRERCLRSIKHEEVDRVPLILRIRPEPWIKLKRYLGVMDDLERALTKAPEDEACAEWVAGIELIYAKLKAILEAEGVETIEAEGERFDPNYHEAISYEENDEFEGGSIIEVTQKGYKLGNRILRPAMVRVAK